MQKSLPSRAAILDVLGKEDRAFHAKEIAGLLDVPDKSYDGLLRLLDDLAFNGLLAARDGHKFKLTKRSSAGRSSGEEREGFLTINPRGFGFVTSAGAPADDVFIPKEALAGAMHGDRVAVRITARSSRGAEGTITRVLDRSIKRVAGVLRRRGKSAWLEPDDTRVRGPITLPSNVDSSGPEGNSGKDGDAAVVTLTRYPELPDELPEGKLEAVLGTPGEIRVEVAKILVRDQIDELHSEAAFAEAAAYGEEVPTPMLEGREDLTHLPLPTIDPEDARDHDDAVWVERTDEGGYRAFIAIADVSSYVVPGTRLDLEAKTRGCSVYLPDRAIPMLPRPLSSNLCSLLPNVLRLCLCADVTLDAGGSVTGSRLVRGFMKSQAKLTYGGVARALGFTEVPPRQPEADALVPGLRIADELARKLRTKRLKRGALDFDLPEAKIVLDPESGMPTDIQRRDKDPGTKKAYQLIEELMLLANEVVARYLVERKVPTVFRVHEPPDEKKLTRFATMAEQLGIDFDVESTKDPKLLSLLLKSFEDHESAQVLNMLLLRSMKQATYDVANVGHFGLASKAYLHFTSPIRRYPDLVVHRSVHALLLGKKIDKDEAGITLLAEAALAASVAERKAMEVEREITDLYRAVFMKDKVGQRFVGTITALVGSGAFVALDAPFVDVLIRFEDMGQDRFELDDEGLRAVATRSGETIQLGDRITVDIIDVAILRRTVYARRVVGEGDTVRKHGNRSPGGKKGGTRFGPAPSRGRTDKVPSRDRQGRKASAARGRPAQPARGEPPARDAGPGKTRPGKKSKNAWGGKKKGKRR
jgi:ribonuclease R